jgi:RNA polymerase sigma-70 factor (ECF subfamily)
MCVVLVDMEQLDYEETSRVMGIPTGTVRSRLSRGRMKLQELLGPNFSPHQEDHS